MCVWARALNFLVSHIQLDLSKVAFLRWSRYSVFMASDTEIKKVVDDVKGSRDVILSVARSIAKVEEETDER